MVSGYRKYTLRVEVILNVKDCWFVVVHSGLTLSVQYSDAFINDTLEVIGNVLTQCIVSISNKYSIRFEVVFFLNIYLSININCLHFGIL